MLLYPEFNLQSKNTSHTSRVINVKTGALQTLYGAIDFSVYVFKSSKKRS